MRLFVIALQFLTIVPLPFAVRCDQNDLGRSMAFFPLAGLVLGLLLATADAVLMPILPRPVVDLILVALLAVVTGALHLDGLADVCDGLAARGSRERFLAVMKDSRIGAAGGVALFIGLMLKYQALLQISPESKLMVLLLFPVAGRFSQVLMTVGARGARQEGLGALFITGVGMVQLAAALLATLFIAYAGLEWQGVLTVAAVALFAGFCRWYATLRLGGITGDVIGCVSELSEITCLLLHLALSRISL